MADHSRRDLADQHAAWFVKVARRLCGDAPPTWDHVEFMLAEEFEHGFKHGREAKPAVVGPADREWKTVQDRTTTNKGDERR